ncbi:MAG: cyclic nucleotide-binding domain-containing protein [Desulfobacterales bacterium]|nr:cyclic nucleotide-binding domain-containing protein [Desulfobacterales bacterium]
MPICLKIAKTSEEKNHVYQLRHKVFVEEEKRFCHHSDHIIDRYDSFEETVNILAFKNDIPIATIRLTTENPIGLPAFEHYDFTDLIGRIEEKCACLGWFCSLKKYRKHRGLIHGLLKMCVREMRKVNARHILATLHPPLFNMLAKSFSAKPVGEEFLSERLNTPMLPIHIDIELLPPGTREASQDPLQMIFSESDERRIYQKDEIIIKQGESGNEVFLIMRGSVRLLPFSKINNKFLPNFDDKGPLSDEDVLLGPGQIFGEISLIDGGKRTKTVIPNSREVDVMVWPPLDFIKQLQYDRNKGFEVCKILANRLRQQIEGSSASQYESLIKRILIDASRNGKVPVEIGWLAKQSGIWLNELEHLVALWSKKKWIDLDRNMNIHVLDVGAIEDTIAVV